MTKMDLVHTDLLELFRKHQMGNHRTVKLTGRSAISQVCDSAVGHWMRVDNGEKRSQRYHVSRVDLGRVVSFYSDKGGPESEELIVQMPVEAVYLTATRFDDGFECCARCGDVLAHWVV